MLFLWYSIVCHFAFTKFSTYLGFWDYKELNLYVGDVTTENLITP